MNNNPAHTLSAMMLAAIILSHASPASHNFHPIPPPDNWPQWRGPLGSGETKETNLPLTWSAAGNKNIRWKTSLPGPGMSSPIVWGDRVFLTQSLDKAGTKRALLCFDRKTGVKRWESVVEYSGKESTYESEPHYCSSTPVTDGLRVIAFFGSAGMLACDINGKTLWKKDLGKCEQLWGTASSPIMYNDKVILNFGPGERTALLALNKRTGEEIWRVDVPGGKFGTSPADWVGSWATPVMATVAGMHQLFMPWPDLLKAYDPLTGKELWSCAGLGKLDYTTPLVTPDVIVAMSGFNGPAIAVRTGGSGDVTATHRLWREEKSTQRIGSGVIVGDHIYMLNESGLLQCIEWKTGTVLWNERATGRIWSSLVRSGDRLYATDQQGETVVIAAKPKLEILARNPLGERVQATMAVSNGELFIRTYDNLWCIGVLK